MGYVSKICVLVFIEMFSVLFLFSVRLFVSMSIELSITTPYISNKLYFFGLLLREKRYGKAQQNQQHRDFAPFFFS